MKLATTRWRYGAGYINTTRYGTFGAFVSLGHGRRRRAVFKTLAEAKAWILAGASASKPDQLLMEDALRARENLPGNVTLEEASRFWREAHRGLFPTPLEDAVARYRAEAFPLIRPRTAGSYRQVLDALRAHLGPDSLVESATADRIEEFLAGKTPQSRNNHIRALSAFFNWCKDHDLAGSNPVSRIKKARIQQAMPGIFAPEEVSRFLALASAKDPATVAYFALCFFAGLRPEEAFRIRPANILNGYVVLSGAITKTADARTVKVRPNLAAWLDRYPIPARGFVEKRIKAVRQAFGKWAPDIARHSFATYTYEMTGDAVRTAAEMGHSGTAVFFKHYRALAAPGSGKRYFSIIPGGAA